MSEPGESRSNEPIGAPSTPERESSPSRSKQSSIDRSSGRDTHTREKHGIFRRNVIVAVAAVALGGIAAAADRAAPTVGVWVWIAVAGLCGLASAWCADERWKTGPRLTLHTAVHWGAFAVAALAVLLIGEMRRDPEVALEASPVTPVLFVMTLFYAGTRFGWPMLVAGLASGLLVVAAAIAEKWLWIGGFVLALVAATALVLKHVWAGKGIDREMVFPRKDKNADAPADRRA